MELTWTFPVARPHAGPVLANGLQGLLVWGGGRRLVITVGRAGFWDHRGGNDFASRIGYPELRRLLEDGDHERLHAVFAAPAPADPHAPRRPYQLGGGRVELELPPDRRLARAVLDTDAAVLAILVDGAGTAEGLELRQDPEVERAALSLPPALAATAGPRVVAHRDLAADALAPRGVPAPERIDAAGAVGFHQALPEDPGLALLAARRGDAVVLATALGADPVPAVRALVDRDDPPPRPTPRRRREPGDGPLELHLPDPVLQETFTYGAYKLAAVTPPQAPACTLQGPLVEAYRPPPWSNDYHFNVNVQMIYRPLLDLGLDAHWRPLWDLLRGWLDRLRTTGQAFFAAPGALMLPHAVDDRCRAVGDFWTGCVDHGCAAWMASLAWRYYTYTGDADHLRELAWPLLTGAFVGYWAMLEETADAAGRPALRLPVGVSPEFKGKRPDAWGANASFQLAACHRLARILPRAAAALGEAVDPRWARVAAELPPYTTVVAPRTRECPETLVERIALWEGMDLVESHRHHSHLAGIYPFCTVDPRDPEHRAVVAESLFHWTRTGPGAWSGWCVPWAAAIHARCARPDAAVAWLHWWRENFVNEGRGTLHDAAFPGTSTVASDPPLHARPADDHREVMQLDAGCGALSAIVELLVQERNGVLHVLPALPRDWRDLAVAGLRCPGGFRLDVEVAGGRVERIAVAATRPAHLRLAHGLGPAARVDGRLVGAALLDRDCAAGERLELRP